MTPTNIQTHYNIATNSSFLKINSHTIYEGNKNISGYEDADERK